ncbi:CapA family protein [Patescibacteria group bacterium]|nr:CapA family protein [Patescibacteria group bacterium]
MKIAKLIISILAIVSFLIFGWSYIKAKEFSNPQLYTIKTAPYIKITEPEIKLVAVGDIMLGRTVEQKMIDYNDWAYPFRETYQATTTGDIVFGNLEAPLIKGLTVQAYGMVFRAAPQSGEGLDYGGFNVISLANNHINNQGAEGIASTIENLEQLNIAHTGAGQNLQAARQPAIIQTKNTRFGFLAYTDNTFTSQYDEATDQRAGALFMKHEILIEDIKYLQNSADVIIISMHAGNEYSPQPSQQQIDFAHTAIDNGAKLVIGHHPHVLQPIEYYGQGYIIYSLGNFIFDQMWSEPTRESAIAEIIFQNNEIKKINLLPIKSFDYCQPRVQSEGIGEKILNHIPILNDFTF